MKKLKVLLPALFLSHMAPHSLNACDAIQSEWGYKRDNTIATKVMTESFAAYYALCNNVMFLDETMELDLTVVDPNLCCSSFNIIHLTSPYVRGGYLFQKKWYILTNEERAVCFYDDLSNLKSWMAGNGERPEYGLIYRGVYHNFPMDKLANNEHIFADWTFQCDLINALDDGDKITNLQLIKNYKTNEVILFGSYTEISGRIA